MNTINNQTARGFQDWFTEETPRSLTAKSLQCSSLLVVFILTFVGNGSVGLVLYKNFSIKNVPNMLLFCLTMVNFFIAILNIPFAVVSTATDEWLFGNISCELSGFFNQFLTFTSNGMVTAVALYRYQAIAKTFSAQITLRGAKWITAFVWFYSLVCSTPPLFGWNSYRFSRKKGFCTLHWEDGGSGMVYTLLIVVACYLVPFSMIVFMYVRIAVITRQNSRNMRMEPSSFSSRTRSSLTDDVNSGVTTHDRNGPIQRLSKRYLSSSKDSITESKTITSVSYVMMTYVLFLAPYYVMNVASALSQDPLVIAVDFTVGWLHYCHAAAVAVVYGYLNRRIRVILKQLPWWPKCQGCRKEHEERFVASPYVVDQGR